ncbi:MAG TPA: hypothetical protein VFV94_05285, partial [Polyangiaceae bacterium]|nr:hypothetical protein [Polyangiaceae bacterium]
CGCTLRVVRLVFVVLAATVSACGGSSGDDDAASGAGGQSGSATSGGGGSGHAGSAGKPAAGGSGANGSGGSEAGADGSGTGGASTGGSSGMSGTAGTPAPDCTGTFGEPTLVMDGAGERLGGLTLSADELELIYEASPMDAAAEHHFRRSTRERKDDVFLPGDELTMLDDACLTPTLVRSGELSNDGLRFYFGCYQGLTDEPQPVRIARRKALDAEFVLDSEELGTSLSGLALDADELMIVTSPATKGGPLFARTRALASDVFGPEITLIGLDGLITPDLSSDGQHLFASRYTDVNQNSLVTAERTGPLTFSTALTIRQLEDPVLLVGSPAISADCRSLYYVNVTTDREYSVMVMRR